MTLQAFAKPIISLFALGVIAACSDKAQAPDDAKDTASTSVEASLDPATLGDAVSVAGGQMYSGRNIVENIAAVPELSTLSKLLEVSRLGENITEAKTVTMFAPTNAAFAALPKGTVEALMTPENDAGLVAILGFHLVAGEMKAEAIERSITGGVAGFADIRSSNSYTIKATLEGEDLVLGDTTGGRARVVQSDIPQANGLVHIIDGVLMPPLAQVATTTP